MNRYFLTTIAIFAITTMVFTACTKKSETKAAALTSAGTNTKIMHGDLSDFAGTWVNGDGERVQLKADGMWGDDGIRAFDFKKTGDGANAKYSWNVLLVENDERLGDIYIVLDLFPSGVDNDIRGEYLVNNNMTRGIFPTDNTKDRIVRTASIMSDSPFISSSVYYREDEYPAVQPQSIDPDTKFLTADISAFAGTWVDVHGQKMQIKANGRLQLMDNNLHYFSDDYEADVYIFPAGVEFVHWSGTVITDTTKDRVFIQYGSERTPTNDDVYYREEELPAVTISDDWVLGSWMFKSGSFVNFFGQAPSIDFLTDKTVNVYEQGDQYLRLARSGIWGYTPEGRLFVEYNWNTYYFLFSSDVEELIIIDSDGDRGVFGKVYG